MSNMVRDNNLRALVKMQMISDNMKSVYPSDRSIIDDWKNARDIVQSCIDRQEKEIIKLDKQE